MVYTVGMHHRITIGLAGFLLLALGTAAHPLGDKALHALAGASCALLASAALSPLLFAASQPPESLERALVLSASGLGAALLAGAVKELLDLGGFGRPEWLDLAATLAGGLAAAAGVLALSCLASNQGTAPQQLAPAYASFGLVLAIPVSEALLRRVLGRRSSVPSTPACNPGPVLRG
jgi:hypothetical protein